MAAGAARWPHRPERRLGGASRRCAGARRRDRGRLAARDGDAHRARTARRSVSPDGATGRIPFSEMRWARPRHDDGTLGPAPRGAGRCRQAGRCRDGRADRREAADAKGRGRQRANLAASTPCARCRKSPARWWRWIPIPAACWRSAAASASNQPVRPGDPGQAAAGLLDQAVRLSDGARPRFHAVDPGRRQPDFASAGPRPADVDALELQHASVPRADASACRS